MANGIGWNTILRHLHVSIGSTRAGESDRGSRSDGEQEFQERDAKRETVVCIGMCLMHGVNG